MPVFQLARTPPQWLRVLLVGLLLGFALNSIAHAAHTHDPAKTVNVAHSTPCGYCATFGGLCSAPSYAHAPSAPALTQIEISDRQQLAIARHPSCFAQPRAPPIP